MKILFLLLFYSNVRYMSNITPKVSLVLLDTFHHEYTIQRLIYAPYFLSFSLIQHVGGIFQQVKFPITSSSDVQLVQERR